MVPSSLETDIIDYRDYNEPVLSTCFAAIRGMLQQRYRIRVEELELADAAGYIGSYDTRTIVIRKDLTIAHKLFLAAHLFGHCVQWCCRQVDCAYIEDVLLRTLPSGLNKTDLRKLRIYEEDAAGYAVQLLSDATTIPLEQWFSDWSNADWRYFMAIGTPLQRGSPADFLEYGTTKIAAKPIPLFQTHQINNKYAY